MEHTLRAQFTLQCWRVCAIKWKELVKKYTYIIFYWFNDSFRDLFNTHIYHFSIHIFLFLRVIICISSIRTRTHHMRWKGKERTHRQREFHFNMWWKTLLGFDAAHNDWQLWAEGNFFCWLSQGQKLNYAHLKLAVLFKMMMTTMTTTTTAAASTIKKTSSNKIWKSKRKHTLNHVSIR